MLVLRIVRVLVVMFLFGGCPGPNVPFMQTDLTFRQRYSESFEQRESLPSYLKDLPDRSVNADIRW